MKQIKTTIVFIVAIAAMAAGIWGDRQLDAKHAPADPTPEAIVETIE